jgi:hypothetical protein
MLLGAAALENLPGRDKLGVSLTNLGRDHPRARFWGRDLPVASLFASPYQPADQPLSLAAFIIRRENREAALARLRDSPNAAIRELLQSRSLNRTTLISPSASAAGQAFDAAVAMGGLLLDGGHLTAGLSDGILDLAGAANQGGDSLPLEQVLMDFMSLGERLDWDQFTALIAPIPNVETLHHLAESARLAGPRLPVLFAAVQLSGRPAAVADYLVRFPESGLPDLGASLRYGAAGVRELAGRQQRFFDSPLERRVTAIQPFGGYSHLVSTLAWQIPWLALGAKWLFFGLAGFFLASALTGLAPSPEPPQSGPGWHWLRETTFSLGFLLVVLLLTEPFLAQEHQEGVFSLRLLPSAVGGAVPGKTAAVNHTIMNPITPTIILTLVVFFVVQALLYLASRWKLAEIQRQSLPPRMKLKLLENEDHLFDAGLYLGFFGTIASLIIASLGLVKFSLMAAYSSTSFGIIFVVVFKIFHLRPARRQLLLAAEAADSGAETRVAAPTPPPQVPS